MLPSDYHYVGMNKIKCLGHSHNYYSLFRQITTLGFVTFSSIHIFTSMKCNIHKRLINVTSPVWQRISIVFNWIYKNNHLLHLDFILKFLLINVKTRKIYWCPCYIIECKHKWGDFDLHVLRHEVCKHSNNTTTALTTTIAMKRWEKKNS